MYPCLLVSIVWLDLLSCVIYSLVSCVDVLLSAPIGSLVARSAVRWYLYWVYNVKCQYFVLECWSHSVPARWPSWLHFISDCWVIFLYSDILYFLLHSSHFSWLIRNFSTRCPAPVFWYLRHLLWSISSLVTITPFPFEVCFILDQFLCCFWIA